MRSASHKENPAFLEASRDLISGPRSSFGQEAEALWVMEAARICNNYSNGKKAGFVATDCHCLDLQLRSLPRSQ